MTICFYWLFRVQRPALRSQFSQTKSSTTAQDSQIHSRWEVGSKIMCLNHFKCTHSFCLFVVNSCKFSHIQKLIKDLSHTSALCYLCADIIWIWMRSEMSLYGQSIKLFPWVNRECCVSPTPNRQESHLHNCVYNVTREHV